VTSLKRTSRNSIKLSTRCSRNFLLHPRNRI
jgi:hypothetical protein